MLNLDTHILIFAVGGALRPAERALLAGDRWSISAIVLWEIAKLAQLGRITMDLDGVPPRSGPGAEPRRGHQRRACLAHRSAGDVDADGS